ARTRSTSPRTSAATAESSSTGWRRERSGASEQASVLVAARAVGADAVCQRLGVGIDRRRDPRLTDADAATPRTPDGEGAARRLRSLLRHSQMIPRRPDPGHYKG